MGPFRVGTARAIPGEGHEVPGLERDALRDMATPEAFLTIVFDNDHPRWIEFRSDLPKTATGKIQRFKLRAEGSAR